MRDLIAFTAFVALVVGGNAVQLLQNEPTILYADVSPKLRIITKSSAFSGKHYLCIVSPDCSHHL